MSFSFRNIFSSDEGDVEGGASGMQLSGQSGPDRQGIGGGGIPQGSDGVSYQAYLASELLAFIPPAISARSGIPMEKEVHVPFSAEGDRDVRLSTLYLMCPELFAAEITPLNDSFVTLPPRLGISSSSSNAIAASGRAQTANHSDAAGNNPFWSPVSATEPKTETGKTFGMKEEIPMPWAENPKPWPPEQKGADNNPFSSKGQHAGNAFAGPGPGSAIDPAGSKIAGGFDGPPSSTSGGTNEKVNVAGGFQGFETSPPTSVFQEGRVDSLRNSEEETSPGFSDNPFDSKHGFTTLFSKGAAADSGIPFPDSPVSKENAVEPEGVWGAMFHGGAASPSEAKSENQSPSPTTSVFEGFGSMISKAAETQETAPWGSFSAPFAEDSPFESIPETHNPVVQSVPPRQPAREKAMDAVVFEPLPVPSEEEGPTGAKKPVPEVSWTIGPSASKQEPPSPSEVPTTPAASSGSAIPPKDASEFVSVRSRDEAAPTQPGQGGPEAPAGTPKAIAESVAASGASASPVDQGFDLKDLELKAIFSTSESFTLSKVARCIVGLPGISSCALSTPGKLVQASRTEESRIGNEAREMVTTLRNLAKLTGLPEARTFTLHTDRGIVSLFLEGEHCVIVHHDAATFPPGVREKLILVARNLIHLEE